jgi:thiamine-monophosphate kinase
MGKKRRVVLPAVSLKDQPEEELVRRLAAAGWPRRNRAVGLRLGLGDDAALWAARPGYETLLTCDWFLEGTHFLKAKHPPDSVGWKCLARAVSDVAAMGGEPRCFLVGLALPMSATGDWLDGFVAGLRRAQTRLGCVLAGGDTTESERVLINVAVIGEAQRGQTLQRHGAKPGDLIYVSGRLGEAELGWRRLRNRKEISGRDPLLHKHLYPEPRLKLGAWLANRGLASAMMDLSDGLSTDLTRLCAASRVGARVDSRRLPVVNDAQLSREDGMHLALHGGDDYELLFTAAPPNRKRIPARLGRLQLTEIGVVTRDRRVLLARPLGGELGRDSKRTREEPLMARGWDPFRRG